MQTRQALRSVKSAISHVDLDAATDQARSGLDKLKHLPQNVSDSEKKLSILGGSALGALALTRISRPSGWLLLGAAAALIVRGTTGYCGLYKALDIDTNK